MERIHRACKQAIAPRLILCDDGDVAVALWCEYCGVVPRVEECDPPTPFEFIELRGHPTFLAMCSAMVYAAQGARVH